MNRRLIPAILGAIGCATAWAPPQDEVIHGGDSRVCDPSSACVDVAVAVDTSLSAGQELGEGSGIQQALKGYPDARAGSRLWVALEGLHQATQALNGDIVAVSLIGFAGELERKTPAAWIEASLTNDYRAVERASLRMRERGTGGASCHACAVGFTSTVLSESARNGRCTVLVVLGDEEPTLPHGPGFMDTNRKEIGDGIRRSGIRVPVFVVVGEASGEATRELDTVVTKAGGRVERAGGSAEVAEIIENAVASCDYGATLRSQLPVARGSAAASWQ